MKRKLHTKTMAIMLATATVLQATEIAPLLANGEAFVTAKAFDDNQTTARSMGDVEFTEGSNITTAEAVYVRTNAANVKEPELNLYKDVVVTINVLTGPSNVGVTATTTVQVRFEVNTEEEDEAIGHLIIPQGTVFAGDDGINYALKNEYRKNLFVDIDMTEKPELPEKDYLTVYNTTTPGTIKLTWDKATDDETAQSNLRYYLYEYQSENRPQTSIYWWENSGRLLTSEDGSNDINEWYVNNINNTSVYYFQLIVKDAQGNATRYATESYTKAISKVQVLRDKDSLEALIINKLGHELFIDSNKISYNWSIDGATVGTNKTLPLTEAYANKKVSLTVKIEGYDDIYKVDYLPTIDSIGFFRENNTLSVYGFDSNGNLVTGNDFKFTYEWIVDGKVVSTDKYINLANYYDKEITANVYVNDEKDPFFISGKFKNIDGVSSKISGIPQNGQTLKAVVDNKGKDLELKYAWWRMDDKDADSIGLAENEGKAVFLSGDNNYTLNSLDLGKYIRLVVFFKDSDGEYREIHPISTTERIVEKKSSGSSSKKHSSSSSSSSSSSDSANTSGTTGATQSNTKSESTTNSTDTNTAKIAKSDNGAIKLLDKDGQAVTGWQQVNGNWYFADANGSAQTGWKQVDGKWYLLNTDGVMTTGWQQTNGKWYLLNNNGSMSTGWQTKDGKWYLLNNDGSMATGWEKADGKWYYLYSDGSMASNTVVDGYTVGSDGAWI